MRTSKCRKLHYFGGTCLIVGWFSVALDLKTLELNWIEPANVANYVLWGYLCIGLVFCCYGLGTLELNMKFGIFLFHKLLKPLPPHQVVNGKWITSSTVQKSPKRESGKWKRESGVLLPTFKTSRDKDDFKKQFWILQILPSSSPPPPPSPSILRPNDLLNKASNLGCLLEQGHLLLPGFGRWWAMML